MNLRVLVTTLLAALLLASCADPITEIESGLTDDALSRLGATVGTKWENRKATNITITLDGNPDSKGISKPVVIKEGNIYRMWYSGMGADMKWRVIYGTSKDGITWDIPRLNNPVLYPEGNEHLDAMGTEVVSVVYDSLEERYKMWYIGHKDGAKREKRLFYAVSRSPDKGWIKYPNDERSPEGPPRAILEREHDDDNDPNTPPKHLPINSASVLREVNYDSYTYHPLYNVWLSYNAGMQHKLVNARSFNGTDWKLQDFHALPLLKDSFFVEGIMEPVVIRDYINTVNAYKLWFMGTFGGDRKLGYAISETDGTTFNYFDAALTPLFGKGEPGEDVNVYSPWIIRDGNKYKMWYIGESANTKTIFYRESLDG